MIPISALHGDNVAVASDHTPFYDGPTLLEYLEEVDVQADRDLWRLRVPVQWVGRPGDGGSRRYAGTDRSAERSTVGDEVVVLPAGVSTTITELDTLDGDAARGRAADVGHVRAGRPARRRSRRHAGRASTSSR